MNTLINGQVFKVSIVFLVISAVMMMIMKNLRALFKKNKKVAFFYGLFIMLTFAMAGFLSSSKVFNDIPINSFYGFQFVFLVLGIVHLLIIRRYFPVLADNQQSIWPALVFTLAYLALGLFTFLQVVGKFKASFSYVFLGASIMFLIPFLIQRLFEFGMAIPAPVFRSWRYPMNENIKDPSKDELAHPVVISLEFRKSENVDNITNFRVKAPQGMQFGRLFYFFLVDYNERHPEGEIKTLDERTQQPFEWVFYFKPNWYSGVRHINFDKSISENDIKENSVIICSRVLEG